MQTANVPATAQNTMALINGKSAIEIPEMELVKNKYVENYNACNEGGNGEFMYGRNLVFLQQALNSTDSFRKCNPFSVYQVMTTIAAYGYSVDPADNEIYLIPRDGRLCISKQAGAHLKRLYKTKQIVYNGEPTLIYEGDVFTKKDGIISHEECYKSDKIIGGYVKFTLDEKGTQRHISYKMSDIEVWRSKSQQSTGSNWVFGEFKQPAPGFLRTKIMLHACQEKCWIPGNSANMVEAFDVFTTETEDIEAVVISSTANTPAPAEQEATPPAPTQEPAPQQQAAAAAPSFLKKKSENPAAAF